MDDSLKRKRDDDEAGPSNALALVDYPGIGSEMARVDKRPASNVHTKKLEEIEQALDKYGFCTTLDELVKNAAQDECFGRLLQIYAQPGSDKLFSVAKANNLKKMENTKSMDIIKNLKVVNEGKNKYMTPQQTLAMFNGWCAEQDLNAHELAYVLKSRLNQRATKKIGLYFHGQTGSGKTYWTAGLFTPLKNHVGKLTNGGRFMFQECNGKSIVIGEEVGITSDNVDRFKELMSGVEIPVEIKNKANGRCHADLVLMNSNVMPGAHVPREVPNLKTRMFTYQNLRQSSLLKKATGLPNIEFLNIIKDPSDEELEQLTQNCLAVTGDLEDVLLDKTYRFEGDWEDFCYDTGHLDFKETPAIGFNLENPNAPKRVKMSSTTVMKEQLMARLNDLFSKPNAYDEQEHVYSSQNVRITVEENTIECYPYRQAAYEPDSFFEETEQEYSLKEAEEGELMTKVVFESDRGTLLEFKVFPMTYHRELVKKIQFCLDEIIHDYGDGFLVTMGPWTLARTQTQEDEDFSMVNYVEVVRSLLSTGLMIMQTNNFEWKADVPGCHYNLFPNHFTPGQLEMEKLMNIADTHRREHALGCLGMRNECKQEIEKVEDEVDGFQDVKKIFLKLLIKFLSGLACEVLKPKVLFCGNEME